MEEIFKKEKTNFKAQTTSDSSLALSELLHDDSSLLMTTCIFLCLISG